jgi:hypothetical protein
MAALGVLCCLELYAWFALAKTYSRGGVVAVLGVLVCFFAFSRQDVFGKVWRRALNVIVRAALFLAICLIIGFAGRMSPGHLAQDASVSNRLELWRGALAMAWDSPFAGWGFKQGGMAYVNWYQPMERSVMPTSLVNGYLELAVGHNVVALFLVLSLFFGAILIAFKMRGRGWCVAAGACLLAWLIGNVWTCLWHDWSLWVLPGVSMLLLCIAGIRKKIVLTACIQGAGTALLVVAVLLGAGFAAAQNTYWRAKPLHGAGTVELSRRDSSVSSDKLCGLWVDGALFGNYYGKTIRASFRDVSAKGLVVYAPWYRSESRAGLRHDVYVFSGFHADRIETGEKGLRKTVVLFPTVYPPETVPSHFIHDEIMVCLPLADISQYDGPWHIWAATAGIKLIYSPSGGRTIQTAGDTAFWEDIINLY